jgi:hypothetical protein
MSINDEMYARGTAWISLRGNASINPRGGTVAPPPPPPVTPTGDRLLYTPSEITKFQSRMTGDGPFYSTGDAGHGGQYSPGDGARSATFANEFLANPSQSYWTQPTLPITNATSTQWPSGTRYARPMHAAWSVMTQPNGPNASTLRAAVKAFLLSCARNATLDYSNSTNYPKNIHGSIINPIFDIAHWFHRTVKTYDMLGRDAFSAAEHQEMGQWLYGYANWVAGVTDSEMMGKHCPDRYTRNYSTVNSSWATHRDHVIFDQAHPPLTTGSFGYTNRNAAFIAAASIATNYLVRFGWSGSPKSVPNYGTNSLSRLLEHSRLFVEECLRFSVWPEGFQGDFGRASTTSPTTGVTYSFNVLANMVDILDYHAVRGDYSVLNFGTTAGLGGSNGVPVAGGFPSKSVAFYCWAMNRYIINGWSRTLGGAQLVNSNTAHDVLPSAILSKWDTNTQTTASWRRSGSGFPNYPQSPQSQGPWHAYNGEGHKLVGLIEVGGPY